MRSCSDSVQSVHTSKSKHVSSGRKSLHNEESQPRNTVQAFWGTTGVGGRGEGEGRGGGGGPTFYKQNEGEAAPSLADLWAARASHRGAVFSSHN